MCSTTTPTKAAGGAAAMESSKQLQQISSTGVGDSDDEQQQPPPKQQTKDIELAVPLIEKTSPNDDDDDSPESLANSPTNKNDAGSIEWVVRNTKKNANVLSACSFYSFCSVSMVLVNKSLASRYVEPFFFFFVGEGGGGWYLQDHRHYNNLHIIFVPVSTDKKLLFFPYLSLLNKNI